MLIKEQEIKSKQLGQRIKIIRKERKLSSAALAELADISPEYVRQIESGRRWPSTPVLIRICEALEVSPNVLLIDYVSYIDDKFDKPEFSGKEHIFIEDVIKCLDEYLKN